MAEAIDASGGSDGNRSRERMKQEVAYLRVAVAQLEAELSQLRSRESAAQVLAVVGGGDQSVQAQAVASAAWQDIAERQRRLRYEAEVENSKLRAHVEDQIRVAKTLEKLLHRKQHVEVESMISKRAGTASQSRRSLLDDRTLVDEMTASLADLASQVYSVFSNRFFETVSGPFRRTELRFTEERGTYVETAERRLLPFKADTLGDAVMHQFSGTKLYAIDAYDIREISEECVTHVYDISSVIETARFHGTTRTKLVSRRVHCPGATVFVFAALSDPDDALGVPGEGLYVRHSGWTRLREVQTPPSPTVTEYLSYHCATPEVCDAVRDQKRKIGALANYVLATIGFQMDVARENMDNWLLAHATEHDLSDPPVHLQV